MMEPVTITMPCNNCGEDVQLIYADDPNGGTQLTDVVHAGCGRPTVTMICDNPRKLGVVTGVT